MLLLMVAGGEVRARTMLAEASVGGGLVNGYSFWWWETRRAYCVVKRSCCIEDGVVVVVVVEERRFARVIKVGAGSDASGGRTAELLKVAASGSGVVTSSGAWTWSSVTERRVLECCSFSSRRER